LVGLIDEGTQNPNWFVIAADMALRAGHSEQAMGFLERLSSISFL